MKSERGNYKGDREEFLRWECIRILQWVALVPALQEKLHLHAEWSWS